MASIKKSFLFTSLFIFTVCFGFISNAQELVTNGDFESGGTANWTTAANGSGEGCGFYAYSGTSSFNGNSIEAPPLGTHAASSDTFDPPCSSAIYQDITVPAGKEVSCFLIYYYKNFGDDFIIGPGLDSSGDDNQQARIDIMTEGAGAFDTGSGVLKNLVQTMPGDPNTLNYTTLNFDLTEYAGTTVKLRAAQADNQGLILFAIDGVTCTVDDLLGGGEISSVPTLTEWGLIVMSLALGVAGFIIIRRRLTASNY